MRPKRCWFRLVSLGVLSRVVLLANLLFAAGLMLDNTLVEEEEEEGVKEEMAGTCAGTCFGLKV